ncbi:MAG: sugar ABC transporter substrate-binding protein [Propionibacteriaceae bacterium]|nr:sugar ABC transporter substrate-binding protein [Propionibacteriaceae bacterium]
MTWRKTLFVGAVVAGLTIAAGCTSTQPPTPAPAESTDTAAKSEYNIALIRWDSNDVFFNGVQAGEEEEWARIAKEEGVKINTVAFGSNDAAEQTEALKAQIAKGIDGVSLVSYRAEAMKGVLAELAEEGIPVVTHNSFVPGSDQTYVSFDGVKAGELAAQAVVDTLDKNRGKEWREGNGVFIELRCLITLSTDVDRHNGMHKVIDPIMAANDKLEIVIQEAECDGEKGRTITDDAISKYGIDRILGIMTIDGTAAVGGAIPALKAEEAIYPNTDPKYIPVASVDCSKPELDSIIAGELTECSEQPAKGEGIVATHLLWDMIKNKTLKPTLTVDQVQANMTAAYGEQPWLPVVDIPVNGFTGQWYGIQSFSTPGDLAPDAPGHWAE